MINDKEKRVIQLISILHDINDKVNTLKKLGVSIEFQYDDDFKVLTQIPDEFLFREDVFRYLSTPVQILKIPDTVHTRPNTTSSIRTFSKAEKQQL